jgi:hypothetical protein
MIEENILITNWHLDLLAKYYTEVDNKFGYSRDTPWYGSPTGKNWSKS